MASTRQFAVIAASSRIGERNRGDLLQDERVGRRGVSVNGKFLPSSDCEVDHVAVVQSDPAVVAESDPTKTRTPKERSQVHGLQSASGPGPRSDPAWPT